MAIPKSGGRSHRWSRDGAPVLCLDSGPAFTLRGATRLTSHRAWPPVGASDSDMRTEPSKRAHRTPSPGVTVLKGSVAVGALGTWASAPAGSNIGHAIPSHFSALHPSGNSFHVAAAGFRVPLNRFLGGVRDGRTSSSTSTARCADAFRSPGRSSGATERHVPVGTTPHHATLRDATLVLLDKG